MGNMKWALAAIAVASLHAQVSDQVRQATVSGSRGTSGKCRIEVRVDMTAEVDIYGDSGRLRTLSGQPATWTRFECTDPLPYNMSDFRFHGVDGRGQVRLVQDPRNNNSTAVIRIEDPRSGSEGYTFEIEWSGASGGAPTGGFQSGGYRPSTDSNSGGYRPGRRPNRNITSERAIDLCRNEVRTRAERDYNLRNIDITAALVDSNPARGDWVTGTFNDRSGNYRRTGGGYRFNCAVDYNAGQVQSVEFLRADGTTIQPGASSVVSPYSPGGYDQNRVFRACQDAVIARTNRDGYKNVNFVSTSVEGNRNERVIGSITANRGPVSDTFDYACTMDFNSAAVRNLDLKRR